MQNDSAMKAYVVNLLASQNPAGYYFHNVAHTLYVCDKANEIGQAENCTPQELELLNIAALWHDAGYIHVYNGHELESCGMVTRYMTDNHFSAGDIEVVCRLIMATRVPQRPESKLEKIMADADLEYLGTPDAPVLAESLFRELHQLQPSLSRAQWNHTQVDFLRSHHYFTDYCVREKTFLKNAYLEALEDMNAQLT